MRALAVLACIGLAYAAGLASAYLWPSLLAARIDARVIDPRIVRAKDAVRQVLKDPMSAYFEQVSAHETGGKLVVCGYMNSKNAMGGYVGLARFMFDAESNSVVIEPTDWLRQFPFNDDWTRYCGDQPAEGGANTKKILDLLAKPAPQK